MDTRSIYKSPAGERAVMGLYDSVLSKWPVPYQTRRVLTRHGDTFVLGCGEKTEVPPLVLLHGAASNSAIWMADVAEYSRQGRVYAVDLLGEPGKSAPNRPAWDSPAFGDEQANGQEDAPSSEGRNEWWQFYVRYEHTID